jgi:hypothetical protein
LWRAVVVAALLVGGAYPAMAALTEPACLAKKLDERGKLRKCQATENGKALRATVADPASCQTRFDARLASLSAQAKAAAIPFRFGVHGDGTVTDYDTGLQWEQKTNDGTVHAVVDLTVPGCRRGGACIDEPVFGPTIAFFYWSAITVTAFPVFVGGIAFGVEGSVVSAIEDVPLFARAARSAL